MVEKIKLLIVEDNDDDVLLVVRQLKKDGFEVQYVRVQGAGDFRAALNSQNFNLVLSDYALPNFNGFQALEIFNEINPEIPFIIVSGTIGEELAVEAMKKGAHDYLMKDKLNRLAPAVRRELKEARIRIEKKKNDQALIESEKKYRQLVESSPDAIIVVENGNIEFVNNQTLKLFEAVDFNEIIGKKIKTLLKDCNSPGLFDGEDSKVGLGKISTFLGNGREVEVITVPLNNSEKSFQIVIRDITKKKELEETIRTLSSAVVHSPLSIIITDPMGSIKYINPKYEEESRYDDKIDGCLLGQKLNIMTKGVLPKSDYESMWENLKNGKVWKGEFENKGKCLNPNWETVFISPIFDDNNNIEHYVVIKENIQRRKNLESQLIMQKDRAERADKLKSEFLAQMSHEIRSPINVLLGFSTLIQTELTEDASEELKESFRIIAKAGRRIIRTIDLILNMSEINTKTYDYFPKQIDLKSEILDKLHSEYSILAKEKGIDLNLTSLSENTSLIADEYSVRQIFSNLIDNAINYTEKGKVDINLKDKDTGEMEVEIIDTGIGIASEFFPNLFKPFSQEMQGYTRKFEGNGLGLALVKGYCELNKASLSVESEKQKGTRFSVRFKHNSESNKRI